MDLPKPQKRRHTDSPEPGDSQEEQSKRRKVDHALLGDPEYRNSVGLPPIPDIRIKSPTHSPTDSQGRSFPTDLSQEGRLFVISTSQESDPGDILHTSDKPSSSQRPGTEDVPPISKPSSSQRAKLEKTSEFGSPKTSGSEDTSPLSSPPENPQTPEGWKILHTSSEPASPRSPQRPRTGDISPISAPSSPRSPQRPGAGDISPISMPSPQRPGTGDISPITRASTPGEDQWEWFSQLSSPYSPSSRPSSPYSPYSRSPSPYQGIHGESLSADSGEGWKTYEARQESKAAQNRIEDPDLREVPIVTHHILARIKINSIVIALTPEQQAKMEERLGIPNFASMRQKDQYKALCSRYSNLFIGPHEDYRSKDDTHLAKLDRIFVQTRPGQNRIQDPRTSLYENVERIISNRGKKIKKGEINPETPFTNEEFEMIIDCFAGAQAYHINILKEERIDENFCRWEMNPENDLWDKEPKLVVSFKEMNQLTAEIDPVNRLMSIAPFIPEHLSQEFMAMDGDISVWARRTIEWRGGLPTDIAQAAKKQVLQQIEELSPEGIEAMINARMSPYEKQKTCPDLEHQKGYLIQYSRTFFNGLQKIRSEALSQAFLAMDGKFIPWLEDSFDHRRGFSKDEAHKIGNAISREFRSLNPSERAKIEERIAKHIKEWRNENVKDVESYIHEYIESFTKIEAVDKSPRRIAYEFIKGQGKFAEETMKFSKREANIIKRVIYHKYNALSSNDRNILDNELRQKLAEGQTIGGYIVDYIRKFIKHRHDK